MTVTAITFTRICEMCEEEFKTDNNTEPFCEDCKRANDDSWDEMFLEKFNGGGFVKLYQKYGMGFHDAREELIRIGELLPNLVASKNSKMADKIVEMAADGMILTQVAEETGVDKSGLRRFCDTHYIVFLDEPKIEDQYSDICKLAEEGQSAKNIAEVIGFTESGIMKFCKRRGINVRNKFHQHIIIAKNKYILIKAERHPNSDSKGYIRLHRLIAEIRLGRYLNGDEDVHHKDGNTFNNHPDNLEVISRSEHTALHARKGDCGYGFIHKRDQNIV